MAYERLVGLHVTDAEGYERYREAMRPILEAHGGSFRYDFAVAAVLRSEAAHPINRLFIIAFPDKAASDRFFSHPEYLKIRETYFTPAVQGATLLAAYSR